MTTTLDLPRFSGPALCAETDPDLFHPPKGDSNNGAARRVCGACEVRDECLAYALDRDEQHGIWGGLSPSERRRLKHRRPGPAPINHGTEGGYRTHLRRGEKACSACLEANRLLARERHGRRNALGATA